MTAPSCSLVTRGILEHGYQHYPPGMTYTYTPFADQGDVTVVARIRKGTVPTTAYLFDAYNLTVWFYADHLLVGIRPTPGADAIVDYVLDPGYWAALPADVDMWLAIRIDLDDGNGIFYPTAWTSIDGRTWTSLGTRPGWAGLVPAIPSIAAPDAMLIGVAYDWSTWPWDGRIYSVELRTGLDPIGGALLWRFDGDDYPGTGTTYVDPRGRTWTLSAAGAIVPKVIGPVRFADTAAELVAGEPTALAELAVSWGRGNTFEQPTPATCTFAVLDRRGGTAFAETLRVGDPLEVHAAGDIAQGIPIDVAIDGGFETSPTGAAGNRVAAVAPAAATIVAAPTATGARALELRTGTARAVVRIPPAAFTPGNPAGWDSIPRLGPNEWTWTVAVRPAMNARTGAIGIGFADPQTVEPTGIVGAQTQVAWGDASSWTILSDTVRASPVTADDWLGISVDTDLATWAAPYGLASPYAWTGAPGTWADYAPTYIDDVALWAPAGGTVRDVLVFAGRISDLAATIDDPSGTVRIDVIAVDQLADLENRYVGDEPWTAEPFADRVERILSLAAVSVPATIDAGLADLIVTWRDVDSQSAGALIAELAAGVDGVLWSATHSTTGPYIWIEDVTGRAQVESLELINGLVTIVIAGERPAGRTALDGCQIPTSKTNSASAGWVSRRR